MWVSLRVASTVEAALLKSGPSPALAICACAVLTVASVRQVTDCESAGLPSHVNMTRSGSVDGLCLSACGYAGVGSFWDWATFQAPANIAVVRAPTSIARCARGARRHLAAFNVLAP